MSGDLGVWFCAVFWLLLTLHSFGGSSDIVPWICWNHSPSLGITALRAPTTTGITLAFTFQMPLKLSFGYWYQLLILLPLWLSLGTITFITIAAFWSLSTTKMSG